MASTQKELRKPKLPPLVVGVKREEFRQDDPHAQGADDGFKNIRQKILDRDKYACVYCKFRSSKYQEVHHLDDNHHNNKPQNLATVCPLCHQVHHAWFAGHRGSGSIVMLEGFTQGMLNQLVRMLWIAELSADEILSRSAQLILSNLAQTGQRCAKNFMGTYQAKELGEYLYYLPETEYRQRQKVLKNIFLMPQKQGLEKQIEFWHDEVFKNMPPDEWISITESWVAKIGTFEKPRG